MIAVGRLIPALGLAAWILAGGVASAAEEAYTAAAGDSAASLAQRYYGDAKLGELLLLYNDRAGKPIQPGDQLMIPFCEVHKARPGETWSGLAKRHLGRVNASAVLAELNGSANGQPLRVGARVVLPIVVRHTLARGESLSILAKRYYGDMRRASTLQAFSRIEDVKRLAVGTPLEIPLVAFLRAQTAPEANAPDLRAAAAAPPPAKAPEVASPPPVVLRRYESELAAAGQAFTDGEYDRARELLEGLREGVTRDGTELDRRQWSQLLAFAYIALDRDDEACAAYRSGSPAAGPPTLDPDLVSPRIRAALSKCAAAGPSVERLDNPASPEQIPSHAGTRG